MPGVLVDSARGLTQEMPVSSLGLALACRAVNNLLIVVLHDAPPPNTEMVL